MTKQITIEVAALAQLLGVPLPDDEPCPRPISKEEAVKAILNWFEIEEDGTGGFVHYTEGDLSYEVYYDRLIEEIVSHQQSAWAEACASVFKKELLRCLRKVTKKIGGLDPSELADSPVQIENIYGSTPIPFHWKTYLFFQDRDKHYDDVIRVAHWEGDGIRREEFAPTDAYEDLGLDRDDTKTWLVEICYHHEVFPRIVREEFPWLSIVDGESTEDYSEYELRNKDGDFVVETYEGYWPRFESIHALRQFLKSL